MSAKSISVDVTLMSTLLFIVSSAFLSYATFLTEQPDIVAAVKKNQCARSVIIQIKPS